MQIDNKRLAALILCLAANLPGAVLAQMVGETVVVADDQLQDFYGAGQKVLLQGDVTGDAVLAGGSVLVSGRVSDDLTVAGGEITITGDVGDDLRAAGGQVTLTSSVGGHAVIAGGSVNIESEATINDWAWLSGGSVNMKGWVTGDLHIVAGEIEVSGRVDGNVDLTGSEISIADGAVINGDLTFHSNDKLRQGRDVTVTGRVIEGGPLPGLERESGFMQGLMSLLTVMFAVGVFYTLFRRPLDRCYQGFQANRGRTLLIGLGVLLLTPFAILLLFATGIGLLLGLLFLIAYALAIAAGSLAGIALTARWGLERFRHHPDPGLGETWLAIGVVVLVMMLLYVIPAVGVLTATLVMLLGLGAMAGQIYGARAPAVKALDPG
jgi:cytoskeletal protein CcmA (bactofilin family)